MKSLDEELAAFVAWRKGAGAVCGQPVPSEIGALLVEQSKLEALRWEAEDWRAKAVSLYYQAKARTIERLWIEVAKTALNDIAKAQAYKELWLKEAANGVAEAVISRRFTVAQELKRLGGQA